MFLKNETTNEYFIYNSYIIIYINNSIGILQFLMLLLLEAKAKLNKYIDGTFGKGSVAHA